MFDKAIYKERRNKLVKIVGSGLILLPGNKESSMNYKNNFYPFRQDSSFLYFFGTDKPGITGIIDADNGTEVLYGDDAAAEDTIWTGNIEKLGHHAFLAGVPESKLSKSVADELSAAISKKRVIHYLPPYRDDQAVQLSSWLGIPVTAVGKNASVPLIKAIVSLRSCKSPDEITEIEKAVSITAEMQREAMRSADSGISEAAVAANIQAVAIRSGGNLSFPSILTVNGQILHNGYSDAILQEGQIVLCDCGAETKMHYAGDLTRTFPVGKAFTSLQLDIYNIVFAAYQAAVSALKPGVLFIDIHLAACRILVDGLKEMKLMKGDTGEAVAAGAHALFFPCGLGHMMGLDTHDMENLGEQYVGYTDDMKKSCQFGLKYLRFGRALETGFVLTVEPGLYFNEHLTESWSASKQFTAFINYPRVEKIKNFGGIRIENDFLITGKGSRILGPDFPVTAEGLVALRNELR